MKANTVQNTYGAKKQNTASSKTQQKNGFLSGSHDLFGFFKKDQTAATTQSASNDLLKIAYKMLEQAERDLSAKKMRIEALENILTVDELTSLTNRRGFFKSFKREIDLTNREKNRGGLLIMIDLDYFKTVNDTFGHSAGDKALKIVGSFLQKSIRNMDIAARLGGDEFIVLFPNTSIAQSLKRAQRLGQELNALNFEWQGETIKIQASLGLKEYKKGDTIDSVIDEADKCMYQDKASKKNTRH